MTEVGQPSIGAELTEITRLHRELDGWRSEAEFVLAGQDDALPSSVSSKPWHSLDEASQSAVADRGLIEVVLVGRLTVAKLIQSGLSARVCEDFEATMAYYRESLPLDGGQQLWVYQAHSEVGGGGGLDSVRQIMEKEDLDEPGQPDQIVTGGRLRAVHGPELVSRLWDWMREGGEFSDGSSYRVETRKYLKLLLGLFGDWRYPDSER